jgi:hypothetical protein
MLAKAGERGRELRQLNKSRGGAGGKVEADAEPAIKKKGKKGNTAVEPRTVDKPPRVEDGGSHAQGRRSQFRHFVADGEELYRLDGAHFAIFGPMDNNVARQRAADMRRTFSRADLLIEDTQLPMTSSIGVVTVDRILSNSLAEIANKVQEALLKTLYRAKEKGGNTVELHNTTKF